MIRFSINGKRYKMPSLWKEVDVATFQRLAHLENDYTDLVALMAALMGIEKKELTNSKADLHLQTREALRLVADEVPLWEQIPHKDKFTFKGEQYDVPKDLEMELFGQKVLLNNKLAANDPADCVAYAVALYMQPGIDGEFDDKKITPLEEEILALPVIDIFPIANFFLIRLQRRKQLGKVGLDQYL